MQFNMNISQHFSSYITDWDYNHYLNIGGYGSGKSHATAQKIILKLYEEKRTCLVVRNVKDTIKDSCFLLLKTVLEDAELLADKTDKTTTKTKCIAIESPMEIRFPNGSRIIFRGADSTEKLKSIHGVSIVWIEEASEIDVKVYKELLGRVREPNTTLHFILTCNPVGKENWIYETFFARTETKNGRTVTKVLQDEKEFYQRRKLINRNINRKNGGVYYIHSVVDDNPFINRSYISTLDELKETDALLWIVARWGRFGVNGARVLPNFTVSNNSKQFIDAVKRIPASMHFFGLDFGFETSYNALISCAIDEDNNYLYIYDEVYLNGVTDDVFASMESVRRVAKRAMNCNKSICADSAEPKAIQYYRNQGYKMYACKKYIGSRLQNTKKLKRFKKIICSPKCINTIRELQNLTYAKDKKGNYIFDEFNIDPHTFNKYHNKKLGVYKSLEKLESLKWQPERKLCIVKCA